MNAILSFIDRTTMYRLVLYYLAVLLVAALAASAVGALSYDPASLAWSFLILALSAWLVNELLAFAFRVDTNIESFLITALILVLILPPVAFANTAGTLDLAVIGAWAVASKYVFAFGKKHLFNPAAFAVVLSAFLLGVPATWWVGGNLVLLPFVFLGGLMIVHKLRRYDLVLTFFAVALATIALTALSPMRSLESTLLHSSIFFLAFAMLTEPLTMPPTRKLRVVYAAIVGFLFAPAIHLGSFFFSPELALVIGNVFSYLASPKGRYTLTLVARKKLAKGIYEFVFRPDRPMPHEAGQYVEWTLGKGIPFDSRGNRRYFTIASAPEEPNIALGVRFYESPSGFKRGLAALKAGDSIAVGSLAGDFMLPKDRARKVAFIAGGIGVTPFASMARHMNATGEKRDAVLLYSSKTAEEVAYQSDFARAAAEGLRTTYLLTDEVPRLPGARHGFVNAALIKEEVPDYKERTFYVSGPPGMVNAMKHTLRSLGVSRFRIKTDYFPGLA